MDSSAWIASACAVVALVALIFTGIAAIAAKRQAAAVTAQTEVQRAQADAAIAQTEVQREQAATAVAQTHLQEELARRSQQPYVWADILPDMQQGTLLNFAVGNSGPTMAHNVQVTIDPPLPAGDQMATKIVGVQERLAGSGIKSISPGRTISWSLGAGYDLLKEQESQMYHIRVEAEGPHAPVDPLEIDVDVSDWREARDAPDGSLHHLRNTLNDLNRTIESAAKKLPR
ncbi:hypothetical protein [Occultella kanbiaonis]|uniref:hypothetical protein n=1 Tax=Occultella kanbiaonis TaxID=2675754 RepID=UPI0012B876A6|nr:hypothetical protein [Occultella kanbiaonis]